MQVDPGAGGGLGEAEFGGVEEVTVGVEGRERLFVDRELFSSAVKGVADDGVM